MAPRVAFHPVLFAVFPVLFLWGQNRTEVGADDALPVLGGAIALALVVFGLTRWAFGDHRRAAVATAAVLLLFFSYGHVWELVGDLVGSHTVLLAIWAALAVVAMVLVRRVRARVAEVTSVLNGVAAVLVVMAAWPFAADVAGGRGGGGTAAVATEAIGAGGAQTPQAPRDIYYIVPDRYAGDATMRDVFEFDNSEFYDFLESRGFRVAHDSLAPYGKTAHSLAASLNLRYLDELAAEVGSGSDRWGPVYGMLDDHEVGRFLTDRGYRYVHVGNWWRPTQSSRLADVVYRPSRSEFLSVFLQTTAAGPIASGLGFELEPALRDRRRNAILYDFEMLTGPVPEEPSPKFVFSHITIPHDPYVLEPDGGIVTSDEARSRTRSENYVNHVLYANSRLEELVDLLLAGPDETDPIIVIQADEGPYPRAAEGRGYRTIVWPERSDAELSEHHRILNAYYLPGLDHDPIYDEISPVNTFRVIFDEYFGTDLGLLPDRSYVFVDEKHLYDFVDVTDRVRGYEGRSSALSSKPG